MLEQAVAKIKTEMGANKDSAYVQVVGKFLLRHVDAFPACADKILAEGKTIVGSLSAMRSEANRQRARTPAGQVADTVGVLTDEEGFAVVLTYFGIGGGVQAASSTAGAGLEPRAAVNGVALASAALERNRDQVGSRFDVKLDDFL